MRGFVPSEFPDFSTYNKHRRALNDAQGVSDRVLSVWDDLTGFTRRNPGMYFEIQRLMHDAAQIGYESALGRSHRASDYDITSKTLSDRIKCQFCKNNYYVYGCEPECKRKKEGLPCEIEVKEFLE